MDTGFTCLMYHRLGPAPKATKVSGHYVTAQTFEKQLRLLRRLDRPVVKLAQALHSLEKPQERRPVLITFDDGYRSFFELALPLLERCQMGALVFLVTGLLGQSNAWDETEGDVTERLMGRQEIENAAARGIEFGAHSHSHAHLCQISPDELRREVEQSDEALRWLGKEPPFSFSYPYGEFCAEAQTAVRVAGFCCAFATTKGRNCAETDRFALHRINVRSDTGVIGLAFKLLRERTRK